MVRNTLRVPAFCNAVDFFWHYQLLFFHYLEVTYDVDCSLRCYECELVQLFIFEELVLDLDNTLFTEELAGKVDTDGDLILYALEIEDVQSLIYVFSGYMVEYRTILQCAYYQFFSCHDFQFLTITQQITYYRHSDVKSVLCLLEIICIWSVVHILRDLGNAWERVEDLHVVTYIGKH